LFERHMEQKAMGCCDQEKFLGIKKFEDELRR
jgi:hypothetical protein